MTRGSLFEVIVGAVPLLVLRAGVAFLRMKARRRRGVRVFRRQLRRSGLARWQIKELVGDYEKLGRLRSYLPRDLPGLPVFFN